MGMDQYLLIPFLGEWTSIYQLFWCSPGVQGFDTLPYSELVRIPIKISHLIAILNHIESPMFMSCPDSILGYDIQVQCPGLPMISTHGPLGRQEEGYQCGISGWKRLGSAAWPRGTNKFAGEKRLIQCMYMLGMGMGWYVPKSSKSQRGCFNCVYQKPLHICFTSDKREHVCKMRSSWVRFMSPWSQDVSSVVVIRVPCPYRNIYINIHVALRVAEPQEYCAVPYRLNSRWQSEIPS